MMKKYGFTLIEMLGVFTLLSLILIISVPSLTGLLKKQKENQYLGYLNDIYLATEAYLQSNDFDLSQPNQIVYVKIEDVVKAKFLRSTIINPKTNKKINLEHYIKVVVNEDSTFHYEYLTEAPDLTALTSPTWGSKTITNSNVSVAFTTNTEETSRIKETLCYYGKSNSDLTQLGSIENGTCVYPLEAAYAKVCVVNNSGMYSCSEEKQLAEYLIRDGNLLVDFSTYEATLTPNDGYINLNIESLGTRQGMYATNPINLKNFSYAYADLDTTLSASGSGSPGFDFAIYETIDMPGGTGFIAGYGIVTASNITAGWSKTVERQTHLIDVTSTSKTGYLELRRNNSPVTVSSNIYNVWLQLTN